jgi:hypothetical protein
MTRPVLAVCAIVVMAGPLLAQRPITPPQEPPIPDQTSRVKPSQYAVVIKGCIDKKRLKPAIGIRPDVAFATLRASEFILDGPKELLQQLQEQHDRHFDELQGVAIVPPPPGNTTTSVTNKKTGPVEIQLGTREESGPAIADAPRPVRLRVASLTHISEGCAAVPQ